MPHGFLQRFRSLAGALDLGYAAAVVVAVAVFVAWVAGYFAAL